MKRSEVWAAVVFLGVLVLAAGPLASDARAQFGGQRFGDEAEQDAGAAEVEDVRPPRPGEPERSSAIVYYLIAVVLGGAALGLSMMPSQRTHHD